MCDCKANRSMDIKTPRNVHLSAFYKRSFAFYTVKTRMPLILTSLIDNLVRHKTKIIQEYGEDAREELKRVIGEISEFKYEVLTNKALKNITDSNVDAQIYNHYIAGQISEEGHPTHFHTIWLLTECYMYRRIYQIFEETKSLNKYDYFKLQKEEAYTSALPLIEKLSNHLLTLSSNNVDTIKDDFINLLKINLWGNKCDLSISLGQITDNSKLFDTASLNAYVLSDHSEGIYKAVSGTSSSDIIDIVFDNSGYEVFTDLCLADFMISKNFAKSIRMYVKTIPWFISDVMKQDFYWTLHKMETSDNEDLKTLAKRWKGYLDNGIWTIVESHYWTLPYDFPSMKKVDPALYRKLSEAKAIFFKGDLNYRKLFGEKNWDPATPVDIGLQEFHPSKICILRTIKADIVCGLKEGVAEKIEKEDPKWMETGNWGLIQYSDKIFPIDS